MSTKKAPKSTSGKTGRSSAAAATQSILQDVQLARLGAQLRNLDVSSSLVRAFGGDPAKYAAELARQYKGLSVKQRPTAVFLPNPQPIRLTSMLNDLASIFEQWYTVLAPNATVGLVQTPTSTETGGAIGAEIYTGDLALGGEVYNSGSVEQWWVNTWQYIVPLPEIPFNSVRGPIYYRFNLGATLAFYRQDLLSGSAHVYATVATTNDLANDPIDFSQPVSSDFALSTDLPISAVPAIVGGTAKVTGSISPKPGATPAIGIIVGLIVSVAQGNLQILPGEYSFLGLSNPDAETAADLGKIEYRQDPIFWVEAVTRMLALAE